MNVNTQLGLLTELQCQYAFSERGITLLQPISQDCRYDYVADINNTLIKIQCKTARLATEKTIVFQVSSSNWNTKERHSYIGEIDYFYTYWNNQHYLIPISLITNETQKEKRLRLGDSKEYISDYNATYANDFILDKILFENFNFTTEKLSIEDPIIRGNILIRKVPEKTNQCKKCGALIQVKSEYCSNCANLLRRKVKRPEREELKRMIREIPFTQIAKEYDVSDKAIVKWCKAVNLPSRKVDINAISDEEWIKI